MKLAKSIVLKVTYRVQVLKTILLYQNFQMLHINLRRGPVSCLNSSAKCLRGVQLRIWPLLGPWGTLLYYAGN